MSDNFVLKSFFYIVYVLCYMYMHTCHINCMRCLGLVNANIQIKSACMKLDQIWLCSMLRSNETFINIKHNALCIGECPSIAPFIKNYGPRPRKGPRSIVFKEWNDTRTFAYIKSTHRLQPLPQYKCINLLPYIINYSVHVSIHIIYHIYPALLYLYIL